MKLFVTTFCLFALTGPVVAEDKLPWDLELNHAAQGMYQRGEEAFLVAHPREGTHLEVPQLSLWNHREQKLAELVPSAPRTDGRVIWKLPSARLGYFEIRPDAGTQSWSALGSRPAGKITFAVVEKNPSNPSQDFKYNYLSLQGSAPVAAENGGDITAYLGLQSLPVDYGWSRWEPNPPTAGAPDSYAKFMAQDRTPETMRAKKIWPYFYISRIPTWAADPARRNGPVRSGEYTATYPPQDWGQYEAYLKRVVPYIAKRYDYLPYRVYEVEWEPVIPWGWHGTVDEIVKMFEIAHRVVHQYDLNGWVAGPTLSSVKESGYYEDLLRAGLSKYIDAVGMHTYHTYPPEAGKLPEQLAKFRQLTLRYTGRERPLLGTENGYADGRMGATNQGYAMAVDVVLFKGEGNAMHTMFYATDFAREPGYGLFYNLVNGLPYFPSKISPKPAVPMTRAAIDQIGTAEPVQRLDYLGQDVWGYVFRDRETGELLAALWDASGADRTIEFDSGSDHVQVVDSFGNAEPRQIRDGKLDLALNRAPTYVRGLAPELFLPRPGEPLLQTEPVWRVYRGEKLNSQMRLTRKLPTPFALLGVDVPGGVQKTAVRCRVGDTPGVVPIVTQISATAPLGLCAASVRLNGPNGTMYKSIQRVEVLPEIQVSPFQLSERNHNPILVGRVKNLSTQPWQGTAKLGFLDDLRTQKLSLKPGEERPLKFEISLPADATQTVPAKVTLESQAGSITQNVSAISFFSVPRAYVGDVWGRMQLLPLRATQETIFKMFKQSVFGGDADLSARAGFAYDDVNVYAQFIVRDDIHRNTESADRIWRQDSLQLAFDAEPARETTANGFAESFSRTDSEWGFAFTDHGPQIYLFRAPGGSPLNSNTAVTDPEVKLEGGREGTLTTYQITVPWKYLDPRSVHRHEIGLAAVIADSDNDGPFSDRRALQLFQGIVTQKDPTLFGRAALK